MEGRSQQIFESQTAEMESSNLDSINEFEVDRASFLYVQERTCDEQRHFAGTGQEHLIRFHPDLTHESSSSNVDNATTVDLFQCARTRTDSGSGSDSAKEEHSPYSSAENLKYEAVVASNNKQEGNIRKERTRPSISDISQAQYVMPRHQQRNVESFGSGPYATESYSDESNRTLVPTGSSIQHVIQSNLMPRGETGTRSICTAGRQSEINARRPAQPAPIVAKHDNFKDLNQRMVSFLKYPEEWPHKQPSAEQMAQAGMFYKGVVFVNGEKVNDMVTCYRCGKTLYDFMEFDDPVVEHRKFYPNCT